MSNRRLPSSIDYSALDLRPAIDASLPWRVDPKRCALLIHDMQRHFLAPFAEATLAPVVQKILDLRELCDALEIPVYYSVQPAKQSNAQRGLLLDFWGEGLQDQPERAQVLDALTPKAHHHPFDKWRYSAFAKTNFEAQLKLNKRDQLLVTGVYGHIGCHATVRDAFMRDIQGFAIGDAIADFSKAELEQALHDIAHRCGVVASTQQVLDTLTASRDRSDKAPVQTFFLALTDHPQSPLPNDAELIDLGVDSVRWMTAIDQWNQALGAALAWERVAACESVGELCALLEQVAGEAR